MNSEASRGPIGDLSGSSVYNGALPLVGRVLMSTLFLISGVGKLTAPGATIGYITSAGLPFPQLGFAIAIFVEIGCSIALIAGYRTRWVAAIMAIFCVAAALGFHHNFADLNQFIHFLKNISMTGGFLQIAAFGAGRFGLDARRR